LAPRRRAPTRSEPSRQDGSGERGVAIRRAAEQRLPLRQRKTAANSEPQSIDRTFYRLGCEGCPVPRLLRTALWIEAGHIRSDPLVRGTQATAFAENTAKEQGARTRQEREAPPIFSPPAARIHRRTHRGPLSRQIVTRFSSWPALWIRQYCAPDMSMTHGRGSLLGHIVTRNHQV
jgi:hypothetical protein